MKEQFDKYIILAIKIINFNTTRIVYITYFKRIIKENLELCRNQSILITYG